MAHSQLYSHNGRSAVHLALKHFKADAKWTDAHFRRFFLQCLNILRLVRDSADYRTAHPEHCKEKKLRKIFIIFLF